MAIPVPFIATVAVGVLAIGLALFAIFDSPTRAISYDDRRRRRSPSPSRRPRLPQPRRKRSPSPPPPPLAPVQSRRKQNSRSLENDLGNRIQEHHHYSPRPSRHITVGSPEEHRLVISPARSQSPPPVSDHQENSSVGTGATCSMVSIERPEPVALNPSLPIRDSATSLPVALTSALPGDDMELISASPSVDLSSELPGDAPPSNPVLAVDDTALNSKHLAILFSASSNSEDALAPNPALSILDSAALKSASAIPKPANQAANSALLGDDVASSSDATSSCSALLIPVSAASSTVLLTDDMGSALPNDDMALNSALPKDDMALNSSVCPSESSSVTLKPACQRSDHCESCDITTDRITFIPCGCSFFCRECGLNYLKYGKHCCKCGEVVTSTEF